MTIQNPVLPGFNPDPSICRVDDTFYIATSTFEWFPGVMIYSSTDLQTWDLVTSPLDRLSQLNMAGNPPSGGIWAPCLSYADNQFWLIYTDVKAWAGSPPEYQGGFKDCHNYLVTAPTIQGPWSEPIHLNSSGFDPSLFHDADGKKWLVNMLWDYRPWRNNFAGIILQEYSPQEHQLIGPRTNIFLGTSLGLTEAPHLYKRQGWYYLMTAEGGTAYTHGVTLARSRSISGPYELHPQTPLVTSVQDIEGIQQVLKTQNPPSPGSLDPFLYPGLQKAGHGSMAPVSDQEWVLAHLCGRPLPGTYRCPLGRETALQRLTWKDDGWPWPDNQAPQTQTTFSSLPVGEIPKIRDINSSPQGTVHWREDFGSKSWSPELQTLRVPTDSRYDLSSKPGWLGLEGAESPTSTQRQTLLARRVQGFTWSAATHMTFDPEDFQQFAGLLVRYDENSQYLLRLQGPRDDGATLETPTLSQPSLGILPPAGFNPGNQKAKPSYRLGILGYQQGKILMPLGQDEIPIHSTDLRLGVDMREGRIQFRYATNGSTWTPIGPELDGSVLSDECATPLGFTGMYVGIGCFDVSGRKAKAYFDWIEYSHE